MTQDRMRTGIAAFLILCAGCASPHTVKYTADGSGRWVKTVYSKSYVSSTINFDEGFALAVTAYDEGRVNPVAQAVGALGPESETPPASYVAHFKNTSEQPIDIELLSFKVRDVEYPLALKTATLQPGETLDSGKIMGTLSLWSQNVDSEIRFKIGSREIVQAVVLKQETMDELKARMKFYRERMAEK
jgi:hypothetical protein